LHESFKDLWAFDGRRQPQARISYHPPMLRKPELRLRLKADGRIVEILPDGAERVIDAPLPNAPPPQPPERDDATYARAIRARSRLTQAEFAARIGVPIETVRNWEQGKRSPRGPARALLKLIDRAPAVAFAVLGDISPQR
jgi:putative transcriptional regulator